MQIISLSIWKEDEENVYYVFEVVHKVESKPLEIIGSFHVTKDSGICSAYTRQDKLFQTYLKCLDEWSFVAVSIRQFFLYRRTRGPIHFE